jgi:hypothetical protein
MAHAAGARVWPCDQRGCRVTPSLSVFMSYRVGPEVKSSFRSTSWLSHPCYGLVQTGAQLEKQRA